MTRKEGRCIIYWATLVFGLLGAIAASLYFRSYQLPSTLTALLFVVLAFIGHFTFIAFVVSVPIHLVNLIVPNKRLVFGSLSLLFSLYLATVLFDIQLFALYKFHLNAMVWGLVSGGAAGDIFEFSIDDYMMLAGFSLVVIALVAFCILLVKRLSQMKTSYSNLIVTILLSIMVGGQFLYAWSDAAKYQPVLRQLAVIPWAMPLTAKSFFKKYGWFEVTENVVVNKTVKGRFNYPKQAPICKAPQKASNLLFLVVDTLRFDTLNEQVMPQTSRLVNTGSQFFNHYSTGNSTRFGVFGLFYGVYSNYWHAALTDNTPSILIDSLHNQGYQFGVFASAALTSPEFDQTIFASVKDKIDLRTRGDTKAERDIETTRKFENFLAHRKTDKPFFSMLFYDAAHGYAVPDDFELKFTPSLKRVSYAQLDNDSDPVPFFNRYKNSLAFIDQQIAKAIKALKVSGEFDNTIIVVTSDHGQEFNDTKQNYWGHNSNFSKWQTKVPMAIIYPDKKAKSYHHLTSHVDVVPTLMRDVLGCEGGYDQYSQGWPLDSNKSHPLILINSWSSFATFNGEHTTVFLPTGINETYDKNYQQLKELKLDTQQALKAIDLNSNFLK